MLFKVCARYFPFSPWIRIFRRLAWASPRLEQLPTLKIFFLPGRPGLHIAGLHFQIRQIPGAALQRPYRDIHGAEEIYRILPQSVIPEFALLRSADHDHFLFFKLMDPVYASFLQAVGSLFLAETGRIAGVGQGAAAPPE